MLDERKAAILQAVVQEYIRTAQPVGSNHVVAASAIDVSPATVRNEMAALEVDGYLQQPHTSAGRIPTDKGYRFFVDTLASPGPLDSARAQQVRTFFAHAHGALEQMLSDTSQLLTRLTHHAALVVGPAPEQATIRSVQLVALSSRIVLAVTVLSNGGVERHTIELGAELSEEQVAAASTRLARQLVGTTIGVRAPRSHPAIPRSTRSSKRPRPVSPRRATVPSRSTSVGWRAWPKPSTRSRQCVRCCARSRSNTWWCRSCATSSTGA